jgi:hypothetical protein
VCIVAKLKTGVHVALYCTVGILMKQTSEFLEFDMPPISCDFYAKILSFRKLSITQWCDEAVTSTTHWKYAQQDSWHHVENRIQLSWITLEYFSSQALILIWTGLYTSSWQWCGWIVLDSCREQIGNMSGPNQDAVMTKNADKRVCLLTSSWYISNGIKHAGLILSKTSPEGKSVKKGTENGRWSACLTFLSGTGLLRKCWKQI